jgi:hypothetical protein
MVVSACGFLRVWAIIVPAAVASTSARVMTVRVLIWFPFLQLLFTDE